MNILLLLKHFEQPQQFSTFLVLFSYSASLVPFNLVHFSIFYHCFNEHLVDLEHCNSLYNLVHF